MNAKEVGTIVLTSFAFPNSIAKTHFVTLSFFIYILNCKIKLEK